ncbi:MAG: S1C family serine protease, partial [Actinomycetota bacterium]
MSKRSQRFWLITMLMTVSFLVGSWLVPRFRVEWEPGPLQEQAVAQTPRAVVTADEPVAKATAIASPSVVNIDTVKRMVREDWFYGPQTLRTAGSGSGVVIDPRGYVLTNDHVVAGADEITVTFGNGVKSRGRVMGTDRETDVGLIRLIDPPKDLAVAQLGDSRALTPGQWAIAIGNPYGYQQTVTLGAVGNVSRPVRV